MKIVTEHDNEARACVVRIKGDIDMSTAPDLEDALSGAVNRGCVNLVLDLAQVPYADSSALGLIVWVNRLLEPRDGRLVLAGATRDVSRILELSGLIGAAPAVSAAADAEVALAGMRLAPPSTPPLWTRRLEVPAVAASLSRTRAEVCEMLEPLGLPESTRFDIRVAVGEAIANAIRHGSPLGETDTVGVSVSAHDDRVTVVVTDRGQGFDGAAGPGGDPYAASGRGVMFMRALMDSVEFAPLAGGGTAVTLVKHLGLAPDEPE